MTRPALPTASRVMKARHPGTCPACRGPIQRRELIAKYAGVWMHATCLIDRQHAAQPEGVR